MLPVVYLAWWQRSLWLSAAAHCAGNTIGAALALAAFLG